MQNEPNLKNTKMNLNLFKTTNYSIFRPLQRRKNEPNSNPIYGKRPQFTLFEQFPLIYEIFIIIFTNFYTNSPPVCPLSTLLSNENGNFHPLDHPKKRTQFAPAMLSWPAVRPVLSKAQPRRRDLFTYSGQHLRVTSHGPRFTNKKMQNEPNLKNTKINVSSFTTKY